MRTLYLVSLFICGSFFSMAQTRDIIWGYSFTQGPNSLLTPTSNNVRHPYEYDLNSGTWKQNLSDPQMLFVYEGPFKNGNFSFKVNVADSVNEIYDSIKVVANIDYPSLSTYGGKFEYVTQIAGSEKQYRFTGHLGLDWMFQLTGDSKVMCRNCSTYRFSDTLSLHLRSSLVYATYGSYINVERYSPSSGSYFQEPSITTPSPDKGDTIKPGNYYETRSKFCNRCRLSNFYYYDLSDAQKNEFYNECNTRTVGWGVAPDFLHYTSILLSIPIRGIYVEGYKAGSVTILQEQSLDYAATEIDKIYDVTGAELSASDAKGKFVILLLKNGQRQKVYRALE